MERKFKIKDYGTEVTVTPKMGLYSVSDFMGRDMIMPAIQLLTEDGEPFALITKSFGEFIGVKDCCYMDLNNCPFATELLNQGVARDTGFTRTSGFCTYPLWAFDEGFLREIGGADYERYSKEYDSYMGFGGDEDEGETPSYQPTM